MLDVETVAAGGGSVLEFDGFRARVGPASAGANPGPAAYGRGGPATVTDANLVLGRLDPAHFPAIFGPSADAPLDLAAAQRRLADLAAAMGLSSPEAAAAGFVAVAVEHTAQAIRRISTERGFDPRDHALVAFGGAAGQVACDVADALGIETVLSPRHASLLSAWGIGQARVQTLRQAGLDIALDASGLLRAGAMANRLTAETQAALAAQGAESSTCRVRLMLRYDGADAALPIPLADAPTAKAAFEAAHQRLFGFVEPSRTILIASVEVEAEADESTSPLTASGHASSQPVSGAAGSRSSGLVHRAEDLTEPLAGPALVVRGDTQIAVAEGWTAIRERDDLIRLTRNRDFVAVPELADRPDPVTLELFNRRFMGVAEEMGLALQTSASSANIRERLDFSCAVFDAAGGLVANAPHIPVHLGSMSESIRTVIRERGARIKPGDIYMLNAPHAGGTHLPDITVIAPVLLEGDTAPAFFTAARGHHADIGGITPGSMPPDSRTIEDEGVLIDNFLLVEAGRLREAETRALFASGRHPARNIDNNLADLKAQIAACRRGEEELRRLVSHYGRDGVAAYMRHVQDNAEEHVRRVIDMLEAGSFEAPMDNGAVIRVAVRPDKIARRVTIDFSGTSAQDAGNFNAPLSITRAAVLYVFRTLVADAIPLNEGCLTPIDIITPEGCLLNPRKGAAVVAGNVETSMVVVDALYGAMGRLGASQGTMNNFTFGNERYQYYETICGGSGAGPGFGGASVVQTHMTNSRLTDPEILESRYPILIERFGVRRGSGGEGEWRGGDGAVRVVRFREAMTAAMLSNRRSTAPFGVSGGGDGRPGVNAVRRANGDVEMLRATARVEMSPGDAFLIETPGGGGFGEKP
jgi:5-oxoprolinase (ATP-hydrolysing)